MKNAMAKIFKSRIKSGIMTLEEVPERWREATTELLKEETENHDEITDNQ
nr:MAG TPA: hypothetical protein [Caudoviricetes sp.]